jgi:dUTP pyrophosphatase
MTMLVEVIEGGKAPRRPTEGDVGYDCFARLDGAIITGFPPRIIPLGIKVRPTPGYFIKLESRSGLAAKGLHVIGGIIDPQYRGELSAIVISYGPHVINPGDRICQMVQYAHNADGYATTESLDDTSRGADGFGSTGV